MRALAYNDMTGDRNVVAIVQALEAILSRARPQAGQAPAASSTARPAAWCCVAWLGQRPRSLCEHGMKASRCIVGRVGKRREFLGHTDTAAC